MKRMASTGDSQYRGKLICGKIGKEDIQYMVKPVKRIASIGENQ